MGKFDEVNIARSICLRPLLIAAYLPVKSSCKRHALQRATSSLRKVSDKQRKCNMSCVSRALINIDIFCDFIPGVSIVSNTIDLVAKTALEILRCLVPCAYKAIEGYAIVQHLENKQACACLLLAIPFLNIWLASLRHYNDDLIKWRQKQQ